jgi:hypothetical protein
MVQAIEIELQDSFNGLVGFLKKSRSSHGGDLEKVVQKLQEGFEVKITPAMRRMFFAKLRKEQGKNFKPAFDGPSTGVIRVRGRPFIRNIFLSSRVQTQVNKHWYEGIERALRRLKAI